MPFFGIHSTKVKGGILAVLTCDEHILPTWYEDIGYLNFEMAATSDMTQNEMAYR